MLRTVSLLAFATVLGALLNIGHAFAPAASSTTHHQIMLHHQRGSMGGVHHSTTTLQMIFKKKKDDDEDLSFIETRDMTRDEMKAYNAQFEDTVNQEIIGMTIFSLIISLPLLYLAWVGFFAETAEIAGDF